MCQNLDHEVIDMLTRILKLRKEAQMERAKDQYRHTRRQSPKLGPIRLERRWLGDERNA